MAPLKPLLLSLASLLPSTHRDASLIARTRRTEPLQFVDIAQRIVLQSTELLPVSCEVSNTMFPVPQPSSVLRSLFL